MRVWEKNDTDRDYERDRGRLGVRGSIREAEMMESPVREKMGAKSHSGAS